MIGLAAVDDDALRSAMARGRLPDKAFGRRQVTLLAEEKLDRVTHAVDGAVKIHPVTGHPDISFINVPLAGDRTFSPVEVLKQQR